MLLVNRIPVFVCTIGIMFLSGCGPEKKPESIHQSGMRKLTVNHWNILSEKTYFFGHQSVGQDIIDGIERLMVESNFNGLTLLKLEEKPVLLKPVFAHRYIGRNTQPKSKIDDFQQLLMSGMGDSFDVAFMKFCYIDIDRNTDIQSLFQYYHKTVKDLEARFPELHLVHLTIPLTTRQKGIKGLAKWILGRDNNVFRERYNKMLRESYSPNQIFDVAKVEATLPDGNYNTYRFGIPGLVEEYSYDGRHLNDYGKLLVASELLLFLSEQVGD